MLSKCHRMGELFLFHYNNNRIAHRYMGKYKRPMRHISCLFHSKLHDLIHFHGINYASLSLFHFPPRSKIMHANSFFHLLLDILPFFSLLFKEHIDLSYSFIYSIWLYVHVCFSGFFSFLNISEIRHENAFLKKKWEK